MSINKDIAVVIPAHNESATVAEMVKRLKKTTENIFVVDDASTDNTGGIAKDAGASIISLTSRSGYSQALMRGFKHVVRDGFSHAVTIDADAAHNPDELAKIVEEHVGAGNSLTVGNRFYPEALLEMPSLKRWANFFASRLINLMVGTSLDDVGCGFRVYRLDLMEKIMDDPLTEDYSLAFSSITLAKGQGLKVGSIPVSVYYDASALLYSRKIELINLVSVAHTACKDIQYRHDLEQLNHLFSLYRSMTVKIADEILCIHALPTYEGYIVQRQNPAYRSRVVGECLDFDKKSSTI